jgi:hypothetical protein
MNATGVSLAKKFTITFQAGSAFLSSVGSHLPGEPIEVTSNENCAVRFDDAQVFGMEFLWLEAGKTATLPVKKEGTTTEIGVLGQINTNVPRANPPATVWP